jgi:hypothetical protein
LATVFGGAARPGTVGGLTDSGFFSVGQQPVFTDRQVGRKDPWGNPLSMARQYKEYLESGRTVLPPDPFYNEVGGALVEIGVGEVVDDVGDDINNSGSPATEIFVEVDSAAKAPSMRNVALTPPYFHWGGYRALENVLDFYNRGGNRRDFADPGVADDEHPTSPPGGCTSGDTSGTGPLGESDYPLAPGDCGSNVNGFVAELNLTPSQISDVVAFLKALTDPAVQCDMAPFDHPSLHIHNGHLEADTDNDGLADDVFFELPAVGAAGYDPDSGFCVPNEGDLFAPGMQARVGGDPAPPPEWAE